MTFKTNQTNTKPNRKNKTVLKASFKHENIEINDQYSDEFLDKIDIWMELAMQIFSTDTTVRSDTEKVLKEFNSQSLATRV